MTVVGSKLVWEIRTALAFVIKSSPALMYSLPFSLILLSSCIIWNPCLWIVLPPLLFVPMLCATFLKVVPYLGSYDPPCEVLYALTEETFVFVTKEVSSSLVGRE